MSSYSHPSLTAASLDRHLSAEKFPHLHVAFDDAMERVDTAIGRHHQLVDDRLHLHPPARRDADAFKSLLQARRPDGFLPLSNPDVRRAASAALIVAILHHYATAPDQPDLRYFLFTAVTDVGYSFARQPTFAPVSLRKQNYRALHDYGLHGICASELDVLAKRLAGEPGRRFLQHDHGIVWTADRSFQPHVAAAKLMRRDGFSNALGIPAVTFRSRAESATLYPNFARDRPDEDQTEGSLAHLAYYLLKAPTHAKNRVPRIDKPGSFYLRPDAGHFSARLALRMAEFWSYQSPFDTVYGVGDGKHVRAVFAQLLHAWERANRRTSAWIDPQLDRTLAWERHWEREGHPNYSPWRQREMTC